MRRTSLPRTRLLAATATASLAAGTVLALAPTPAVAATGDDSLYAVVVVLADQLTSTTAAPAHAAARAAAATRAQDAVLGRLTGRRPTGVHHLVVGNAVSATVTGDQLAALRHDRAVAAVADDVSPTPSTTSTVAAGTGAPNARAAAAAAPTPYQVPQAACTGTKAQPQLEPEGLDVIGAASDDPAKRTAASLDLDGTGVRIGFIADGLDPANGDFLRSDKTSAVVENTTFDDFGPGAKTGGGEAFGDAGTLVAQGLLPHDLADYVSPAAASLPGGHCWIRVRGVAPGASLVALNALDGTGGLTNILEAVDHAVTVSKVDVLNESFGVNAYPEASARQALQAANSAAAAAGVTVVVSSGDAGVNGTIAAPAAGADDGVIAVGATTHLRAQVQQGGAALPVAGNGTWGDDAISTISSSGITSVGSTVDLVAPGYGGWAPCSTDLTTYTECASTKDPKVGSGLEFFAGTSQAAPFTSGTAALVVQAYRRTHAGASPTPAQVKAIVTGTATDLGAPADLQGAGRLDALAAVEAAATWPGATTSADPAAGHRGVLAATPAQVALEGAPGDVVSTEVTYRNASDQPVAVVPVLRRLDPASTTTSSVPIDPATATFANQFGQPTSSSSRPVEVPAGTARLRVSVAGRGPHARDAAGPVVTLFDPTGRLVNPGYLQGTGITTAEVSADRPVAGTWTAVVTEPTSGVVTTVTLQADLFTATQGSAVGSVEPAQTLLAPGGTRTVTVRTTVPAAGDTALALFPGGSTGVTSVGSGSVPLLVRAGLRPTAGHPATVDAGLRGGNGRPGAPAQTLSYDVDVPAGAPTLTADLQTPDCGCTVVGWLVDPAGQVRSAATNQGARITGPGLFQSVAAPAAGRWHWILIEGPVIVREDVVATIHGTLTVDATPATAATLPTSDDTALVAGQATTVPVTVHNPSTTSSLTVLVDAQTDTVSTRTLTDLDHHGADLTLPFRSSGPARTYVLPPGTTSVRADATATVPVLASLTGPASGDLTGGGTFVAGPAGTTSSVAVDAPAQGRWTSSVTQAGPFTAPAAAGTGTTSLTVTAPDVDAAVLSPTGPNFSPAAGTTAPVTIAPGADAVVPVTITPAAGSVGARVSGRLVVSTASQPVLLAQPDSGFVQYVGQDVVAYLPYRYRVVAAAGPTPSSPAPTPSAPASPPSPTEPQRGNARALADTGFSVTGPTALAAVLIVIGAGLVAGGRLSARTARRARR